MEFPVQASFNVARDYRRLAGGAYEFDFICAQRGDRAE